MSNGLDLVGAKALWDKVAEDLDAVAVNAVAAWPGGAEAFPYDDVLACFHRVGKHFVSAHVLDALAGARTRAGGTVATFLHTALDKRDGHYDYVSYLALPLLPLPSIEDGGEADRLLVHLMADVVAFELAAGRTALLPDRRPEPRTVTKRLRHALTVSSAARERLGLAAVLPADPHAAAARMHTLVEADQTAAERQALRLSMLPVYTEHDEYMFIRVLQSFETTFARMAVLLWAAVHDVATAGAALAEAERALRESAPLFSLLATMQPAAFRTFRAYTEGASAIQSRNYKLVESLCRLPDQARLDSAAYRSVPDVRARVLAGQPNLDDTVAARGADPALTDAMRRFAAALTRWRQTHHKLAVRMLGDRTGTGYTLGTPYLAQARTIPVFPSATGAEPTGCPL